MAAVLYRFRAELRQRWKGMLGIALLIGLAGGIVLTALAGARRTATALDRTVDATLASDLLLNPDETPPEGAMPKLAALPQVTGWSRIFGLVAVRTDEKGMPDFANAFDTLTAASDGNLFRTVNRERLLEGRYPRPERPGDVIINEAAARRLHLRVGERVPMAVYTSPQVNSESFDFAHPPAPRLRATFTIVGIMLPLDDVARAPDDPDFLSMMLFTAALRDRLASFAPEDFLYDAAFVRLKGGSRDVPAFEQTARDIMKIRINFQERALTNARATRAVRPYVFALLAFGVLAALAALAALGQVLTRSQRHLRDERGDLTALGYTRAQLAGLVALRGALIALAGITIALLVAWLASWYMPIGPMRRVEPSSGMQFDTRILLGGAAAIGALVVAACVLSMLRRPRRPSNRASAVVGDELARAGVSVPLVSGVRFALDRGRDGSVPLRSTLLGITVAAAALVATLVYGAGLSRFTSTPLRYGWPWTLQVREFEEGSQDQLLTALRARSDVAGAAGAVYSQFDIGGRSVAAVGIDPTPGVPFLPLQAGQVPTRDDEVVFGAKTMRDLDVRIGDRVEVNAQGQRKQFRVVGTAIFPRLAPYQGSEPTGLGIGAATTASAISKLNAELGSPTILMNARPGATLTASEIEQQVLGEFTVPGTVVGPQRPNDVQSYDRLRRTPLALVGILVFFATASVVHLLVTGVRNRRRELALLKTMGLTRAQTTRSVLAQATTLIVLSLVVALPLGVLAGRWLWMLTARWLGIAQDASIPFLVIGAVTVGGLALTNLIAFVPGRAAARVQPAVALRAE